MVASLGRTLGVVLPNHAISLIVRCKSVFFKKYFKKVFNIFNI